MHYRTLGRTGLSVSALTLGTGTASPEAIASAIPHALRMGINAIELDSADLAMASAIGEALHESGDPPIHIFCRIAPACPLPLPSPHLHAEEVFPVSHIRDELERLMTALRTSRITLAHLPAWSPEWLDEGEWHATLTALRDQGRLSDFGIATFQHDAESAAPAIASGRIGSAQLMLNPFDQGATQRVLPLAVEQKVAVIARAPLYHGGLVPHSAAMAGTYRFGDWRDQHFYREHREETMLRAMDLQCATPQPLPEAALRYALSRPGVTSVAVGMANPARIMANAAVADGQPFQSSFPEPGWLT